MARLCSPDPDSLVTPTGGDVHAIRSPGHALDFILVALQDGHLLPYATLLRKDAVGVLNGSTACTALAAWRVGHLSSHCRTRMMV